MNTKRVPVNNQINSAECECSLAAVSERLFERPMTFAEVVELSEKCGFWDIETATKQTLIRPLTFVIPSTQAFASVSRMVE
jgi:hypothetical protein